MDKLKFCIDKGIQVMKITNILMLIMYGVIYVAVFNVFDMTKILSYRDNGDFADDMDLIMVVVGMAVSLALIAYKIIRSKNQWIGYIVTIICTILQIILLGVKRDNSFWIFENPGELLLGEKNAIYRTQKLKEYAGLAEDETNVFRCETAMEIFKIIQQLALVLIIVTVLVLTLALIQKILKNETIQNIKVKEERDTILLKRINLGLAAMLLMTFILMKIFLEAMSIASAGNILISFNFLYDDNFSRYWTWRAYTIDAFQSYAIPGCLFLVFVMNNWIMHKKIILQIIGYIIFGYVVYCGIWSNFRYDNKLWVRDGLIIYELLILGVVITNIVFFIKRKRKYKGEMTDAKKRI